MLLNITERWRESSRYTDNLVCDCSDENKRALVEKLILPQLWTEISMLYSFALKWYSLVRLQAVSHYKRTDDNLNGQSKCWKLNLIGLIGLAKLLQVWNTIEFYIVLYEQMLVAYSRLYDDPL